MDRSRQTSEGALLLFASIILVLGFALVFAAKLPELKGGGSVNINADPAERIASALSVDRGLGKLIVANRESNGGFGSTSALAQIRLLSSEEAKALVELHRRSDITKLTPAQLAAKSGLGSSTAERLVEVMAYWGDEVTESRLGSISVVSSDTVQRLDSKLRVRDPGGVTIKFWVYAGLLILGFFLLHLIVRKRSMLADPYLIPCALLLSGLGAIILFSIKDPIRDTEVFPNQIQGLLLGLLAAIIPLTAKYRALRPWRYTYIYAIGAVFLTLMLAFFGTGPGGARLKILGFQPVEITKVLLMFFVASYLADRWSILRDQSGPKKAVQLPLFRDIGPLVVMYIMSLGTFVLVRDLGPMLVLFGMFVAMLYVATGKPSFVAVGVLLIGVTGWIAYALHLGVFDVRVDMWLHPWSNTHPNGMQLGQALWGMGSGGIWGSGLGLGQPEYMSRAGSDLIFASVGEELGLIGSLFVLLLCGVIIARSFRIALYARSDFERFIAAGTGLLLGIQTTIIVYGVLGILPLTGVTFPFMSYGKSSLIASFFLLGLLLNVSSGGVRDTSGVHLEVGRALRRLATGLLILLVGVAGVGRLMWIQGVKGDLYAGNTVSTPDADGFTRAHINPRLKAIEASIPRGSIYDRNGRPLATSKPEELRELGVEALAKDRPRERYYPYGESFAHLVGYVDGRCGGPVGLEKGWNDDLRGFDHYGALLPLYRHSHAPYTPVIEGRDVRLTIDAELQSKVEKSLRKHAGNVRDRRTGERKHKGAAVVISVDTGEVLAAVSTPNFDPNELTPGTWKSYNRDAKHEAVLMDRALNGVYPPGSTFKLVTAAAALENGLDYSYTCKHQEQKVRWTSGRRTFSRKRITDLEEMRAHGLTDLPRAIRYSCNIFFAHLGLELGADRLYAVAHRFGLKRMPPPKKLVEDLPDNAYGQGTIQVTPLEMARVVAAIANDGVMMKPQFVKEVTLDGAVIETVLPEEMGQPMSPESSAALQKMMADVTRIGTARGVFSGLGVEVAGKTGSAENDQEDKRPHSWFVGFAPVEDPRIAFAVVVENAGYGREVAGKVAKDIVKEAL